MSCLNRALKVKVVIQSCLCDDELEFIQSCLCDDELEFMTSLIMKMAEQDLDRIFMKEA